MEVAQQREHLQQMVKRRLNAPVSKLVNAVIEMLQVPPLPDVKDVHTLQQLIISWSEVLHPQSLQEHIQSVLQASHLLRTNKHAVPMDEGKGLAVKQLPQRYYLGYTTFAHLCTGERPSPSSILDKNGALKLYCRENGVLLQLRIDWLERTELAFGLLFEKIFLLFGSVPVLHVDPPEKHLIYQQCVRRLWRLAHKFQEALQLDFGPGVLDLLRLQHCIHARQLMAVLDIPQHDTVLSCKCTPIAFVRFALGRIPDRWITTPSATRDQMQTGPWWNWTDVLRHQALVASIDRQFGTSLVSSILAAPQWQSRPNPVSTQLYIRVVLDYSIRYAVQLYLCNIKPHVLMNKNIQLLLEQLLALQHATPRPIDKLPIPINILPMQDLPVHLLQGCTKMDILDPLTSEALDVHYWSWKIRSAWNVGTRGSVAHLSAVSETLGLLYATFDEEAVESLGRDLCREMMKQLHFVQSAAFQSRTLVEEFAPDVLLVPLHIRQLHTNVYKLSDAEQLQQSREYLLHSMRSGNAPASAHPALDEPTNKDLPINVANTRTTMRQAERREASPRVQEEPQLHQVIEHRIVAPHQAAQRPSASPESHHSPTPTLNRPPAKPQAKRKTSRAPEAAEDQPLRPSKRRRTQTPVQRTSGSPESPHSLTPTANSPSAVSGNNSKRTRDRRRRRSQTPVQRPSASPESHHSPTPTLNRPPAKPQAKLQTSRAPEAAEDQPLRPSKRRRTQSNPHTPIDCVSLPVEQDPARKLYPYYRQQTFNKRTIFGRRHTRPSKWAHGPYRCQTCQQKRLVYQNTDRKTLADDDKHLEICDSRGPGRKCSPCTISGANCFYCTDEMCDIPYWVYDRMPKPIEGQDDDDDDDDNHEGQSEEEDDGDDSLHVLGRATKPKLRIAKRAAMWRRKAAFLDLVGPAPLTKSQKEVQKKNIERLAKQITAFRYHFMLQASTTRDPARTPIADDAVSALCLVTINQSALATYRLHVGEEQKLHPDAADFHLIARLKTKAFWSYLHRYATKPSIREVGFRLIDPEWGLEHGLALQDMRDDDEDEEESLSKESRLVLTLTDQSNGFIAYISTLSRTFYAQQLNNINTLSLMRPVMAAADGKVEWTFYDDQITLEAESSQCLAATMSTTVTLFMGDLGGYTLDPDVVRISFHIREFMAFVQLADKIAATMTVKYGYNATCIILSASPTAPSGGDPFSFTVTAHIAITNLPAPPLKSPQNADTGMPPRKIRKLSYTPNQTATKSSSSRPTSHVSGPGVLRREPLQEVTNAEAGDAQESREQSNTPSVAHFAAVPLSIRMSDPFDNPWEDADPAAQPEFGPTPPNARDAFTPLFDD
ncbi:hypothetical protein CALCODRAFT_513043 [Calocera cornea HHB12733]|uniref:Uncharacterized protein n=1 Tax=Calocera cornea HHB12733 TaxID=1353952 RepID=A0A165CIR7_9BASI|nr:hypothetical protein CALCODRAFT_513043 [Calocera cornea HHB12733]